MADDRRLAVDDLSVRQLRSQRHVFNRRGKHAPARLEQRGHLVDRLREAPRHLRQRREQQIADGVPVEIRPGVEAMRKKLSECGVRRERRQAVADIARRQHAELLTQAAGAPAIVGHGDDRGQPVSPGCDVAGIRLQGRRQSAQDDGQSCAAAESNDARERVRRGRVACGLDVGRRRRRRDPSARNLVNHRIPLGATRMPRSVAAPAVPVSMQLAKLGARSATEVCPRSD